MGKRKHPEERKRQILDAAVEVAREHGYIKMTREQVTSRIGVSPSLIRKYYITLLDLQDAVMREAVRLGIPEIVLQGLAAKDPIAHGAPASLKAAALEGCA